MDNNNLSRAKRVMNKNNSNIKYISVKLNVIFNIFNTICNLLYPLVTLPYVMRILSNDGIGRVYFFSSIANYAVLLASFGISTYGIRAVACVRNSSSELSKISSELFSINVITTFVICLCLITSCFFVEKFSADKFLFCSSVVLFVLSPLSINWFYSGIEQYRYITIRNIIVKILGIILIFIFVKTKKDIFLYSWILTLCASVTCIINFIYSFNFTSIKFTIKFNLQTHIKPLLLLFSSILAVSIYTGLDTIMLGFLCSDSDVGIYVLASKVKWILLSLVNSVSVVLLPRMSNLLKRGAENEYSCLLNKSITLLLFITIPLTLFFTIEADDVIYLLGGKDFSSSVNCMRILMPILIISGLSNITGNQILIPRGKDFCFFKAVCIGAIVNVILNCALIPKYSAVGASIATLIAELAQFLVQLYFSRNYLRKTIQLNRFFKLFIASFFVSVILVILKTTPIYLIFGMYTIFIVAPLFFLIYFALSFLIADRKLKQIFLDIITTRS